MTEPQRMMTPTPPVVRPTPALNASRLASNGRNSAPNPTAGSSSEKKGCRRSPALRSTMRTTATGSASSELSTMTPLRWR